MANTNQNLEDAAQNVLTWTFIARNRKFILHNEKAISILFKHYMKLHENVYFK